MDHELAARGSGGLCSAFVELLPVTGASISVFGEAGRQSTICASDAVAARLDDLQFELGEGPHWEALRSGLPVLSSNLLADENPGWPVFGGAAAELGIRAMFAFPVVIGAVMVGVVDLYRTTPGELGGSAMATALSLASSVAGPAVRQAVRSAGDDVPAEGETAAAVRREVHQATGMILAQLDTTATEAFSRLRAHAFATGRPVQEVAHDVVNRRLDFSQLPN